MKKFIAIFLLIGFLFPILPLSAIEGKKSMNMSEKLDNRELQGKKKNVMASKQGTNYSSDAQITAQMKKEIEAKERAIDKNKKVKRCSVDERLPQIIRERNIP